MEALTASVQFAGVVSASSPIPKGCNFVPGKTRVFGAAQGAYAERLVVWPLPPTEPQTHCDGATFAESPQTGGT